MLDPEYRDASNCYPYQILEIFIPLCDDPIGLIQKGHLKPTNACDASMSLILAFPTVLITKAAASSPSCLGMSITYSASPDA